jgi:hypothetical protein
MFNPFSHLLLLAFGFASLGLPMASQAQPIVSLTVDDGIAVEVTILDFADLVFRDGFEDE